MIHRELPRLPTRAINSHKGDFGHVMLIGGATGMTGAISIAGLACLRVGAGLVTLGIPERSQSIVASFDPNYMTLPLPCDSDGRLTEAALTILTTRLHRISCVAIGPGLGRSDASDALVVKLFETFEGPMLLDADALNALSESAVWKTRLRDGGSSTIRSLRLLTPHPGEWERLSGVSMTDRPGQIAAAQRIALKANCIVLLKGNQTWITDGTESFINQTGNASMAVGGSGDCLTGIIAGLIGQQVGGLQAARLGAHLHGLAGDLAHQALGTPSTLATELIQFLPAAFLAITNDQPRQ